MTWLIWCLFFTFWIFFGLKQEIFKRKKMSTIRFSEKILRDTLEMRTTKYFMHFNYAAEK